MVKSKEFCASYGVLRAPQCRADSGDAERNRPAVPGLRFGPGVSGYADAGGRGPHDCANPGGRGAMGAEGNGEECFFHQEQGRKWETGCPR